jgi:putative redox protein
MAESVHVEAQWQGGLSALTAARGHEVLADEPVAAGGGDLGMMPTELLCAALASCFCLAMVWVAAKRGVELPGLRVTVDGERLGRELRYGRLRVDVAAAIPEDDLAALLERAERFCWVSNMLADDLDVEYASTPLAEPVDGG